MDLAPAIVVGPYGVSLGVTAALFAVIILFHEFGHFVVAKLAKMRVYEFALGFGRPVLARFRIGGTEYTLRPVPIGGFVRIAGMEPDEDVPDGFDKKSIWARLAVIGSGSTMNLALAVILFWVIGVVFGKVVGHTTQIQRVIPGTPAAQAGLQVGDDLLFVRPAAAAKAGPEVSLTGPPRRRMKLEQLRAVISRHPGKPLRLVVAREGTYLAFRITPRPEQEQDLEQPRRGKPRLVTRTVGRIGIVFAEIVEPRGFLESVGAGFVEVYATTRALIMGLVYTMIGKLPAAVGGPVQIADLMADAWRVGWRQFLLWSALISVNVGVINLLPMPALDGSRLVFIIIGGIRRRPIDRRKEAIVHLIGFALILLLLALVTYKDIVTLIDKYLG